MVVQTLRSLEDHRFQAVRGHIGRSCLKRNIGGWRDSSVSLAALAEDQCLVFSIYTTVFKSSSRDLVPLLVSEGTYTLCTDPHIYLLNWKLKKKTKDI